MKEMKVDMIDINKIMPSPFQPRETFEKEEIKELAESIKEFGLLQPIVVKPAGNGNYQIIAGERRWRASQFAGLKKIPAIIRDVDEKEQMAESLIENVHRKDLSGIEKGRATYQLFLLYGIEMPPKKLSNTIKSIYDYFSGKGHSRSRDLNSVEKQILEVCNKISKPLLTIRSWLEEISVSTEIQKEELKKPEEERLQDNVIARLSTIEDEELQKKVYKKLRELRDRGELTQETGIKFIAKIKKAPEEVREEMLTPGVKIIEEEAEEKPIKIELTKEEAEELKKKIEEIEKEREEILAKPETQERGRWLKNWQGHVAIGNYLEQISCPICGAGWEKFGWTCHNINIKEAVEIIRKKLEELGGENEK